MTSRTPGQRYRDLVASGAIEGDAAQLEAVNALEMLAAELQQWHPERRLFGLVAGNPKAAPRGLYIHGRVGRGKTMLMDLFYEAVAFSPKRRVHFHEFMVDVHARITAARKKDKGDPIAVVAGELIRGARLLCFDELHVTDIADAMILGRLFQRLFDHGVVVVATSNAHPSELYKNGLNRQLFLPFIDMLQQKMKVLELRAAKDFRLEKLAGRPLYFSPADAKAHAAMRACFEMLTGVTHGEPHQIDVLGHPVKIPETAMGVALCKFDDLCERPLGANDYLHIAHSYHTVMIEHVPRLTPARRDAARRFINLIDTLYDNRTCLIVSADAEPDELYPDGDNAVLFERTASRLYEMRSEAYLASRAEPAGA